jgi:quercetin dioxygenase-like cupin family protein
MKDNRFHQHPGIELLYLISGKLELHTQDAMHELSEGDAVYFDSTALHSYRRVGAKRTMALVVTTNVERAVRPR